VNYVIIIIFFGFYKEVLDYVKNKKYAFDFKLTFFLNFNLEHIIKKLVVNLKLI